MRARDDLKRSIRTTPQKLVIRWQHQLRPELKAEGESRCSMELEPAGSAILERAAAA